MNDITTILGQSNVPFSLIACGVVGFALFSLGCLVDIALICHLAATSPDWRNRLRRLRNRPWEWPEVAAILLGLGLLNVSLLIGATLIGDRSTAGTDTALFMVPLQTLLFHGLALVLIAITLRSKGASWALTFGLRRDRILGDIRQGIILYVASIPAFVVAAVMYRVLLTFLRIPVDPQGVVMIFIAPEFPLWIKIYLVVLAVAVAPVTEELLFRGAVLPMLLKVTRPAMALVAVSFFFAAIHFHLPSLVPLFVIAAIFATGYAYSGSILVPIVTHMLFNAVNLTALYVLKDFAPLAALFSRVF